MNVHCSSCFVRLDSNYMKTYSGSIESVIFSFSMMRVANELMSSPDSVSVSRMLSVHLYM